MEQARLDLDALDAAGAHELRLRLEVAGQDRAWSERPVMAGRSLAGHPAVDLRQLRDEIRAVPGFERFLAAPEFADVAAVATTPLVYLAAAADRGTALVVRGRSVRSLPLPRLTDAAVRGQAGALLTAQEAYLAAIGAGEPDARTPWTQTLQEIGAWLWTAAGDALSAELAGAAATVVAGGLLGLLPLHAAGRPDPAAPSGWHYLMDDVQLSYVPNARVLSAAGTRASAAGTGRLLAVAQPRPSALAPLPYTGTEAIVAAAAFGGDVPPVLLAGPDATASAVVAALPFCDVAHFGCHGQADLSVPLASALLLRDDTPLSLGELLPLRLDLRLAVLSACETGQPGTALPDEVISLPAGLLQTGAAGVVATGWVVPDGPSAALITEFYRRWRSEDQPPARALAGAQAWLRDTTNGEKARGWLRAVADGAAWLPAAAADALLDLYLPREPDALDDAGIDVWAGFAHYGC